MARSPDYATICRIAAEIAHDTPHQSRRHVTPFNIFDRHNTALIDAALQWAEQQKDAPRDWQKDFDRLKGVAVNLASGDFQLAPECLDIPAILSTPEGVDFLAGLCAQMADEDFVIEYPEVQTVEITPADQKPGAVRYFRVLT